MNIDVWYANKQYRLWVVARPIYSKNYYYFFGLMYDLIIRCCDTWLW